ncbi:MAG TPA: hypothetical protein VNO84_01065 [Burkholderiaceae bacterium]|nr:hypothetical protein [Burkholderiaceae bacterium]
MWIAWPAFLVAGLIEMLVFAFVDPGDLHVLGRGPLELSPMAIYTIAFFVFWAAAMLSSALTTLLARSPFELNRCPLRPHERAAACPRPKVRER